MGWSITTHKDILLPRQLNTTVYSGAITRVAPTWIANPVVVPKANGSGHLCVYFTSLNKACPKDPYPLPRIDQIVDSTAGCDLLCFLDAFSGYHQIKMAREEEEKTAFITPCVVYCYVCMPFGLKNAGATFQKAHV
jgi:hypothetical protein